MSIFLTDFCKVFCNMMRLSQNLFEAVVYSGCTNGSRGHAGFLKLIMMLRRTVNSIYHMNYYCNTIQNLIREGGEYVTPQTHKIYLPLFRSISFIRKIKKLNYIFIIIQHCINLESNTIFIK